MLNWTTKLFCSGFSFFFFVLVEFTVEFFFCYYFLDVVCFQLQKGLCTHVFSSFFCKKNYVFFVNSFIYLFGFRSSQIKQLMEINSFLDFRLHFEKKGNFRF